MYVCVYVHIHTQHMHICIYTQGSRAHGISSGHGKAIDRLVIVSLERVFGGVKRSPCAVPPPSAALYSRSLGGSWHVRGNDPARNSVEDIQNGLCGGRASDLWCNANLSGFYSLPPPLSSLPPFASFLFRPSLLLFFVFTFARTCSRQGRGGGGGQERDERKNEVETADTCRFFKKIAISRKL